MGYKTSDLTIGDVCVFKGKDREFEIKEPEDSTLALEFTKGEFLNKKINGQTKLVWSVESKL